MNANAKKTTNKNAHARARNTKPHTHAPHFPPTSVNPPQPPIIFLQPFLFTTTEYEYLILARVCVPPKDFLFLLSSFCLLVL
jgi:hypothetical protein